MADQEVTEGVTPEYTQQTFEYDAQAVDVTDAIQTPDIVQENDPMRNQGFGMSGKQKVPQEKQDSETDYDNPDTMLTTHRIPPLKPLHNMPRTRLNFDLDAEERAIIAKADVLTREEIWTLLEKKRFEDLKNRAVQLSGNMLSKARCPVCTLAPPCKHYQSQDQLVSEVNVLINQPEFKRVFPPHKRDNLLQLLKQKTSTMNSPNQSSMITHQNSQIIGNQSQFYQINNDSQIQLSLSPEQDPFFQTNMGGRKHSSNLYPSHSPSPSSIQYLKRGKGHGGSPTNFDVKQDGASLKYIKFDKRNPSVVSVRKRSHQGSYVYSQASIDAQSYEQLESMKRHEFQLKQQIQKDIATYREMRFQREQERLQQEAQLIEEQRQRIKDQQEKRLKYMDDQKKKLEEYRKNIGQQYAQSTHALVDHQAKIMQQKSKILSPGRSEKEKALQSYRDDKRKAEQMLEFQRPVQTQIQQQKINEESKNEILPRNNFELMNDEMLSPSPIDQQSQHKKGEESDYLDEDKIEVGQ